MNWPVTSDILLSNRLGNWNIFLNYIQCTAVKLCSKTNQFTFEEIVNMYLLSWFQSLQYLADSDQGTNWHLLPCILEINIEFHGKRCPIVAIKSRHDNRCECIYIIMIFYWKLYSKKSSQTYFCHLSLQPFVFVQNDKCTLWIISEERIHHT